MTLWQNKPDTEGKVPNYRIMRCPSGRAISGVCLTTEVVGTKLHYWKGRSVPCGGPKCEACTNGHIPRWKGYILLYCTKSKTVSILEFTERVWQDFEQFKQEKHTLRGAMLTLSRLNKKANGPLQVRFEELLYDSTSIPAQQDLQEMLARIWEVRQPTLPETPETNGKPKQIGALLHQ